MALNPVIAYVMTPTMPQRVPVNKEAWKMQTMKVIFSHQNLEQYSSKHKIPEYLRFVAENCAIGLDLRLCNLYAEASTRLVTCYILTT